MRYIRPKLFGNMRTDPYAFFFDADHSGLGSLYGPPCTSRIVSSAMNYGLDVNTRVMRGDLLPHLLAYKIASVSTEKRAKSGARSVGHTMAPDMALYKLILCDFADSLEGAWHTVDTIQFPFEMSRKSIWTIVLPSISEDLAIAIDAQTKEFAPYLGATFIDAGNPVHIKLFSLIDDAYITKDGLYYRRETWDEEDLAIAKTYGAPGQPMLLNSDDFYAQAPNSLKFGELSERGQLSLSRINGKSTLSHGQKLAYALLEYLQNNPDIEDISYKTSDEFTRTRFICEENKVKNYLLNPGHPDGGPKAKFFTQTLGISREDWKYLADQISGGMNSALIYRVKNSAHGISHGAFMEIVGRNGRTAIIQTGWIIRPNEAPRLVTAYPNSDPIDGEFQTPLQNISPLGLFGDDKWSDVYGRAHKAGEKAAHACVPTPMTLADYAPIFGGQCGFAWVTVPDARTGMAKWLKSQGIGHKSFRSGWDVPAHPTPTKDSSWDFQSIEPKKAYASAFAKVLMDNGVQCEMHSRLD